MAYGARLESALGASPRGFESPILRRNEKRPLVGRFLFLGLGHENRVRWGPIGVAKRRLWGHSPPDPGMSIQRVPNHLD